MKLVLFILLISGLFANESSSSEKILEKIQDRFSHQGVLKHRDGFVYVDIDDEYVHSLNRLIITEAFEAPPYFGDASLVGAHISVIYPGELNQHEAEKIEEYGQIIEFIPQSCEVASPIKWKGIDKVYLVTVESLQLNCLREKYGLPPLEHAFHITIGVKFGEHNMDFPSSD
ncbi:MAG: hypothetical protein KFB95_03320 [Simkaniaceae bacterium]|nr:MAG: hypothetical protein KFB95_03320 [Simkaniaceae bacterium]